MWQWGAQLRAPADSTHACWRHFFFFDAAGFKGCVALFASSCMAAALLYTGDPPPLAATALTSATSPHFLVLARARSISRARGLVDGAGELAETAKREAQEERRQKQRLREKRGKRAEQCLGSKAQSRPHLTSARAESCQKRSHCWQHSQRARNPPWTPHLCSRQRRKLLASLPCRRFAHRPPPLW